MEKKISVLYTQNLSVLEFLSSFVINLQCILVYTQITRKTPSGLILASELKIKQKKKYG